MANPVSKIPQGKVTLNTYVDKEVKDELQDVAREWRATQSFVVHTALRLFLASEKRKGVLGNE